jgi:hypothetical protein
MAMSPVFRRHTCFKIAVNIYFMRLYEGEVRIVKVCERKEKWYKDPYRKKVAICIPLSATPTKMVSESKSGRAQDLLPKVTSVRLRNF